MVEQDKVKLGLSPAYAPWSEMQATLRRLRGFRPPKVDIAFLRMHRIAPKNERAVVNALRYLGLIDAEGVPTEKLARLQGGDYVKGLATVVGEAYADLFQRVDLKDASVETINNYFLTRKVGTSVAPKCTRFFLGICHEAGIEVSRGASEPAEAGAVHRSRGRALARSSRPSPSPQRHRGQMEPVGVLAGHRNGTALLEAKLRLFEKLPQFDASWKPEAIRLVFQEFHRLADRLEGRYAQDDGGEGALVSGAEESKERG